VSPIAVNFSFSVLSPSFFFPIPQFYAFALFAIFGLKAPFPLYFTAWNKTRDFVLLHRNSFLFPRLQPPVGNIPSPALLPVGGPTLCAEESFE